MCNSFFYFTVNFWAQNGSYTKPEKLMVYYLSLSFMSCGGERVISESASLVSFLPWVPRVCMSWGFCLIMSWAALWFK